MNSSALLAFAITFASGAATSLGACAAFFIRKKDFKTLALAMSFSAGVMIFVSFCDILPISRDFLAKGFGEAPAAARAASLAAFFAGALFAGIIDAFVPEHIQADMLDEGGGKNHKMGKAAFMTAAALAVHNFPEGVSVFFSTLEDTRLGLALALAILLHNIPEGMSVALPAYHSTGSKKRAFLIATFSGMVEPFGALCAYFILMPVLTPALVGACMAATGGIMVYIALDELLPMANQYDNQHSAIIGVFLGMLAMAAASFI